jgi:RNA polymerase sigma-70 factor (ECF subfamily)
MSFDEFFKADFRSVVGFVRTLGASFEEAQDSAAAAMLEVARRWSKLDSPRSYVRTVAKNNFYKSNVDMKKLREALTKDSLLLTSKSYSIERTITEVDAIIDAIRKLSFAQQSVLAWTLQGYAPKEIAELFGQNEDTVRSNLRHARSPV